MFWENPSVLLLLWILPLVAGVLVRAHRKRVAAAQTFADPAMVERLMPSLGGARPWVKGGLLLAGLALLIVAGARPRFGVYTETVTQRGVDLFVLLDVSRSMTAEDVVPSRLERAKSDIRDLLPHLLSDRVGLIVFAGKPVVKIPLTTDQGFFRMVLDEVDIRSAPLGGTLIGDAIRKALETMPRSRDRDQVLVLITDGEDQESYAEDAAKEAAERGVKIFTVGLGDAREGGRIPVRDDAGRLTYVQEEGRERWSKLDENLLKKIALMTGGAYIPAGTRAYDLGQVYADYLAGLTRSEYAAEKRKRYREQFQLFVCLGVALLLLEMGIASYRQPPAAGGKPVRPRRNKTNDESIIVAEVVAPPDNERGATAGLSSNVSRSSGGPAAPAVLLLLAALLAFPGVGRAASREAAEKVQAGVAAYQAHDYKRAAAAFNEADVAQPDDLRIAFDRGMALAAQGDVDKAVELLQKAALAPDLDLAVRARYNLGCLAAGKARKRLGEHPETAPPEVRQESVADLASAVGHFRDCLRMDKDHADARHNLELIRVWLKYMQSLWEQQDRKRERDETDLPAFLQMLEEKQRALRTTSRALAVADESPQRREEQGTAEKAQQKLAEEIGPLKEKISSTLSKAAQQPAAAGVPAGGAPGGTPAPTAPSEEIKQAIARLQALADEAGKAMDTAGESLHAGKLAEAVKPQTKVVELFNELYRDVVPYPSLVGRAVGAQQALVDQNPPNLKAEAPAKETKSKPVAPAKDTHSKPEAPAKETAAGPSLALQASIAEAAWDQQFVTYYSHLLAPMAQEGLKQLAAAPPVSAGPPPQAGAGGSAPSPEEQQKQREGLKKSMEKAVELGPKVEKLSSEAAELLHDRKPAEAQPKQQEALKLLKEIAEPLPKQKPKPDQNKQDKNKPDPKKQQQKPQPKPDQKDQKDQKQQQQQQQAEAAIRQVQQRQQQRKDLEKQLQRYIPRAAGVEKDW